MPDLPADFDLKLMPDWLKEPPGKNPYADYQGGDDDRRSGGRGGGDWGGRSRDDRRGKPGGGQRPGGGSRPGGGPRDDRGGRKDAPGARRPEGGKRPDRPAGPGGARPDDRRAKPGEQRRPEGRDSQAPRDTPHAPSAEPAQVTIEFFPDEGCAISIGRQIKSTHRAYSLFDLARMFLARPERHRLKITSKSVAQPLYQVGADGPISMDKAAAERSAFPLSREKFYVEVTEQREALKGNFSNVARCRSNGVLLGPTNYHGYQPALRKLYEERFSRRMSFSDFQREIEVVSDPALVEQWKEQARNVTVYRLKPQEAPKTPEPPAEKTEAAPEEKPAAESGEGEVVAESAPAEAAETALEAPAESPPVESALESPAEAPTEAPEALEAAGQEEPKAAYEGPVFASLAEVEQHFRETYLPGLIRTATSFHVSGQASREIADRAIASAVRQAWEQERGFPGQMMHQLRQQFSRAGLHIFKHRKRMQFVSLIRPSPMEDGSLSPTVAEILEVIRGSQNCSRTTLAAKVLGTDEAAVDAARKTSLATDLHWLIETGRVIEFSDGRLELPIVPAPPTPPASKAKAEPAPETPPVEQPASDSAPGEPVPAAAIETAPEAAIEPPPVEQNTAPAPEMATDPVPASPAPPAEPPIDTNAADAEEPTEEPAVAISQVSPAPEP